VAHATFIPKKKTHLPNHSEHDSGANILHGSGPALPVYIQSHYQLNKQHSHIKNSKNLVNILCILELYFF